MEERRKEIIHKLGECFERLARNKVEWKEGVKDIRHSEFYVLNTITHKSKLREEGLRVSEISHFLDVAMPTVTQLVNSLEKKGYVKRSYGQEDRRVVKISVTTKGIEMQRQIYENFLKIFDGLIDYLGEEESCQLTALLTKSIEYFSNKKAEKINDGKELKGNG